MDWNAVTAIATVFSVVAYTLTLLYIRAELKAQEKDRFLSVTSQLFTIWESQEFMDAQLWLLHRLEHTTWPDFVRAHRANPGEAAFHRVGGFYDHVGTMVRLGLVRREEILPTLGAYAIAVWQKIQPLVQEARRSEHSTLFGDFELLLPSCYDCYVPSVSPDKTVQPFSGGQLRGVPISVSPKIDPPALARRLENGEPLTVLDVRQPAHLDSDPRTLPGAIRMPAEEVENRHAELPRDREVVVYCA